MKEGIVWEEEGQVLSEESDDEDREDENEDEETRTEVRSGGSRVRLERREDRVILKTQREDGQEEGVGGQESFRVREGGERGGM